MTLLRSLFGYAMERGWLRENPATVISDLRVPKRDIDIPTPEELQLDVY